MLYVAFRSWLVYYLVPKCAGHILRPRVSLLSNSCICSVDFVSSLRDVEDNVHGQTDDHDAKAIDGEPEGGLPQGVMLDVLQIPAPLLAPLPRVEGDTGGTAEALNAVGQRCRVFNVGIIRIDKVTGVVVLLEQALVVNALRVTNLIIEESWQDEADAGGTDAADVGEDPLQARHGEGHEVAKDEDYGREDSEAEIAHRCRGMI